MPDEPGGRRLSCLAPSVLTSGPVTAPDTRALADGITAALRAYPEIVVAYLFGSVARGQARADSDLDVGVVYASPGAGERGPARRVAALAAAIGKATGFEAVDVVDLEAQGPIFAHRLLC